MPPRPCQGISAKNFISFYCILIQHHASIILGGELSRNSFSPDHPEPAKPPLRLTGAESVVGASNPHSGAMTHSTPLTALRDRLRRSALGTLSGASQPRWGALMLALNDPGHGALRRSYAPLTPPHHRRATPRPPKVAEIALRCTGNYCVGKFLTSPKRSELRAPNIWS
jgi:hypothetical protein